MIVTNITVQKGFRNTVPVTVKFNQDTKDGDYPPCSTIICMG